MIKRGKKVMEYIIKKKFLLKIALIFFLQQKSINTENIEETKKFIFFSEEIKEIEKIKDIEKKESTNLLDFTKTMLFTSLAIIVYELYCNYNKDVTNTEIISEELLQSEINLELQNLPLNKEIIKSTKKNKNVTSIIVSKFGEAYFKEFLGNTYNEIIYSKTVASILNNSEAMRICKSLLKENCLIKEQANSLFAIDLFGLIISREKLYKSLKDGFKAAIELPIAITISLGLIGYGKWTLSEKAKDVLKKDLPSKIEFFSERPGLHNAFNLACLVALEVLILNPAAQIAATAVRGIQEAFSSKPIATKKALYGSLIYSLKNINDEDSDKPVKSHKAVIDATATSFKLVSLVQKMMENLSKIIS
jgi:hypothetical protein